MPTTHKPKQRQLEELAFVYPNATGLDIGSAEIVVATSSFPTLMPVFGPILSKLLLRQMFEESGQK